MLDFDAEVFRNTLSQSASINPPRTIIRNSFPRNRRPYPAEGLPKAFRLVLDSTEWSQSDPSLQGTVYPPEDL
ncbi:hypothetical protein CDAR_246011 [Caerostris darwini]|uniref:Uncharacterized protein n=1 Tax=Caerostris darwini TaxID=1538125 RepID=A0AAV4UX93_9ARAC|nr:hypothetical protein CDAR_246011 [Caerostris darwini]